MSSTAVTPELTVLLGALNAQRRHVLGILEGLDEDALRRPVLPSGWSCLALVQHLALDDERFWFQGVVAADRAVIDQVTNAPETICNTTKSSAVREAASTRCPAG